MVIFYGAVVVKAAFAFAKKKNCKKFKKILRSISNKLESGCEMDIICDGDGNRRSL